MTAARPPDPRAPVRFERPYDAPIEDLWDLWTTKEGFESWWGPEGFRVEAHALDRERARLDSVSQRAGVRPSTPSFARPAVGSAHGPSREDSCLEWRW